MLSSVAVLRQKGRAGASKLFYPDNSDVRQSRQTNCSAYVIMPTGRKQHVTNLLRLQVTRTRQSLPSRAYKRNEVKLDFDFVVGQH